MKSKVLYAKLAVIAFMLLALAATIAFPAKVIFIEEGRIPCAAASQQDERSSSPEPRPYNSNSIRKPTSSSSTDSPWDVVPIDEYNETTTVSDSPPKQLSRAGELCVIDVGVQILRILTILAGGGMVLWGLLEYEKAFLRHAKA